MKKAIATLSIILILLNICIPSSNVVYGTDTFTEQTIKRYMEDGTGQLPTKEGLVKNIMLDTLGNNMNALLTGFLEIAVFIPFVTNWLMSLVATNGQSTYTIQDMLLDKYYLFDIDFFNTNSEGKTPNDPNKDIINTLKENVSTWYFTLRNISMIGSALIIIYVAIRLAIEITRR